MRDGGKLREALLEFFFPSRCCFCRRLTRNGTAVCRECGKRYPDRPRGQCERLLDRSLRCLSPLRYDGDVRRALLRYKFGGATSCAPVLACYMQKCLDESGISCDSITWVPLSAKRLRSRGYDQARLLAEALAKAEGLPCPPLLKKQRHTVAQSGLRTREQRQRNAEGAYCALDPAGIKGRRILLVDDIVTSGATLRECARMLRRAGAASVTAITAASRDT